MSSAALCVFQLIGVVGLLEGDARASCRALLEVQKGRDRRLGSGWRGGTQDGRK